MSDTSARSRDFEIDRVISATFADIGHKFRAFIVMAPLPRGSREGCGHEALASMFDENRP